MDYKRVLALHFTNGMSSREIAETTGDGKTTLNEFLKRFQQCGVLKYPLPEDVTNEFIGELLYRKAGNLADSELYRDIDPEAIHRAMTKKGETLKDGTILMVMCENQDEIFDAIKAAIEG